MHQKIDELRKELGINTEFVPRKAGLEEVSAENDAFFIKAAFEEKESSPQDEAIANSSLLPGLAASKLRESSVNKSNHSRDNERDSKNPDPGATDSLRGIGSPVKPKGPQTPPTEAVKIDSLVSPQGELQEPQNEAKLKTKTPNQEPLDRIEEKSENSFPVNGKKSKDNSFIGDPKHERSRSDLPGGSNNQRSEVVSAKELLSADKASVGDHKGDTHNLSVVIAEPDEPQSRRGKSPDDSDNNKIDSRVSRSPDGIGSNSSFDRSVSTRKKKKQKQTQKPEKVKPEPQVPVEEPIHTTAREDSFHIDDVEQPDTIVGLFLRRQYVAILNQIEIEDEFEEIELETDTPFEYDFNDDRQAPPTNLQESFRDNLVKDEDLEALIEENPNDIYAHYRLGEIEIKKGDFSEKLKYHFTKVNRIDPRYNKHVVDQTLGRCSSCRRNLFQRETLQDGSLLLHGQSRPVAVR